MILDKIVEDKLERLKEHKRRTAFATVKRLAEEAMADKEASGRSGIFGRALKKEGISVIGEYKKASPSLGNIRQNLSLESRMDEYNNSVDAISCLTEEDHFKGDITDLENVRRKSQLPLLRKDFMIDEYQFYEAKAAGADAILLIAAILEDERLKAFYELAKELGLDALVETHDEYEIERALKIDPDIIGINNRNLKDFSISLKNTGRLRKYVPKGITLVSESGIMSDEDVKYLKDNNVDAFLIGRALMENPEPSKLVERWKSL